MHQVNKSDLLIILGLCIFAPLYFYNLAGFSLVDFDEAWYGEMAKNILRTHNPFLLYFNGQPFLDAPPFGIFLMAISILVFGASEFAVRFPSALLGFLSLPLIYLIGKNLFNKTVGLAAALILTSCTWFVLRARTADLDAILVFFYLLTFYLAIKIKDSKWALYLIPLSLAALFSTKSFIGMTVVPPAVAYFLIQKIKVPLPKLLMSVIIFFLLITPWFVTNYSQYHFGFIKNMYNVAFKFSSRQPVNFFEINKSLTFIYLHSGIEKWYYPALISAIFSLAFIFKNKQSFSVNKNLIPLYIWVVVLLYGFLTNKKTEIWHLLPIYPPLAILISFFSFKIVSIAAKKWQSLVPFLVTSLIAIICLFQIYHFRNQVKLFDHEISGLAYTAKAARPYSEKLILDTDLFTPAAATFYSEKEVKVLRLEPPPANTLKGLFQFEKRPFLLLSEIWKLDLDGINPTSYQILSERKGHILVKVW